MSRPILAALLASAFIAVPRSALAVEVCGDAQDNDTDGLVDESCWPAATTGVCEQPLSCDRTGAVGPKSGQLVYREPPDLDPVVSYGPPMRWERTYMSQISPGYQAPSDTNFRAPMGYGWTHNYMSWLDKYTAPNPDQVVVRATSGQDVLFTYDSTAGGYDYYVPQAGYHFDYLRQSTSSPYGWELRTLTGHVFEYDWNGGSGVGKLTKIKDGVANAVVVTYNADGQVSTVKDASGAKGYELTYYDSTYDKLLRYVKYYTYSGGTPTLRVTVEYLYGGTYTMTRVNIGGDHARTYTWDGNNKLTQIKDGDNVVHADFKYLSTAAGKVARIETGDGTIGYKYGASGCDSGNGTQVFYNRNDQTATSCDADADCGSGQYCGGETTPGGVNTGLCFEARRCLAVSSPNEDLIGAVSATCSTCVDVAEYAWNTSTIDLKGTKSPRPNGTSAIWISYEYNSDGMVIKMVENDDDSDATNTNPSGARTTFHRYDNSSYPGLVTEVRRLSELKPGGSCSSTVTTDCKRTIYAYTTAGQLDTVEEIGFTYNISGSTVSYDFTTNNDYDAKGRLTQVNGPRTDTSYDIIEYTYWDSTNVLIDEYLKEVKRKKDATTYITTTNEDFDWWGNPVQVKDPNANLTCLTFDADRRVMTNRRVAMNNQTSCGTWNALDLETIIAYDTALRVTKIRKPFGNCMHYGYDTKGRMTSEKNRDDCLTSSSGDDITYTYDDDGQRVKVEWSVTGAGVSRRQEYAFGADRRVSRMVNPVNTSYWRGLEYDADGALATASFTNSSGGLNGKTAWTYDPLVRLDDQKRYKTSSTYDRWDTSAAAQLDLLTQVTDDDSKTMTWAWDDIGRRVKQVTPDTGTTYYVYDPAGNLTSVKEAATDASPITHTFAYDSLNRIVSEDWGLDSCGTGEGAEIQWAYDTSPVTCPTAMFYDCSNAVGRLVYVKNKMFCKASETDKTFDRLTFFSFDDAGRLIEEYHQDDAGGTAGNTYTWNANGLPLYLTPPSGLSLWLNYGSTGSNSDADKVTSVWRSYVATLVDQVRWMPSGPLKEYRQSNTISSNKIYARFSWNLAYRNTQILWEQETAGTDLFKIDYTEDTNGRYSVRDFSLGPSSLQDAYYTYDWLDRGTCDSAATGSCPTSGGNLKSNMSGSPPFTPSGERVQMIHAHPAYGTYTYSYNLVSGRDQISYVSKGNGYQVDMTWDKRGNRTSDDDTEYTHDARTYTHDGRSRTLTVRGEYKPAGASWRYYTVSNAYDERNRRIFKSFLDETSLVESQWFFYYDPFDRLIEVKYVPDIASSSTYSLFQFYWIDQRPIAWYQVDYPGATTTRRFLHADEVGRPLEAYSWPTTGNAARVWAINPDLFAWDDRVLAGSPIIYQPLRLPGQHFDEETSSWGEKVGVQYRSRPPWHSGSARSYDAFTGTYQQPVAGASDSYSYQGQNPVRSYAEESHSDATIPPIGSSIDVDGLEGPRDASIVGNASLSELASDSPRGGIGLQLVPPSSVVGDTDRPSFLMEQGSVAVPNAPMGYQAGTGYDCTGDEICTCRGPGPGSNDCDDLKRSGECQVPIVRCSPRRPMYCYCRKAGTAIY